MLSVIFIHHLTVVSKKHTTAKQHTLGITPTLGNQLSVEQGNSCRNKQHKNKQKENARTHFGFLAQEVKEVYPELVRTDSAGYMYVDYIGMIPLIVNALNEIQAKVDSQETVIAELQKSWQPCGTERPYAAHSASPSDAIPQSSRKVLLFPSSIRTIPIRSVQPPSYVLPYPTRHNRPIYISTICKASRYAAWKSPIEVKEK